MKLAVIAIDYDGTIATDGTFDVSICDAIGAARQQSIAVILVTGSPSSWLSIVAGS